MLFIKRKGSLIILFCLGALFLGACESENAEALAESDTILPQSEAVNDSNIVESSSPKVGWWQPAPGLSWQWQLSGEIDDALMVDVYDIDLFDSSAEMVAALQARGIRVICYISVGSWEDWRADAEDFPQSLLGEDYEGWPGERWLDIRQIDALAPIMGARMDTCQAKGFDAIEPDNIDGYQNETGFALTYADQLAYNIWLADEAHQRGLGIALKNDSEQISDLLTLYDFAITEDCFDQGWCEEMVPFIDSGKAVFAAEYSDTGIALAQFCPQARSMLISAIFKNRELDAKLEYCK